MEPAAATCRLEPDGTITVITGVMDISGVAGGFAVIAAETFGVPVEAVARRRRGNFVRATRRRGATRARSPTA